MRLLILGSNGQLGSEIKELSTAYNELDFIFSDFSELDICNLELLKNFILNNNVNAVINCAAYTAVDNAEKNPKIAYLVNSEGVSNIVKALQIVNGILIHISTDYVFDGNHFTPYVESDFVSPTGVYGDSKRQGELYVLNSPLDAIVIRTSWLYSSYGNNFVKTMMDLGKQKKEINVIFDQIGTPTYAADLAKVCLDILCNLGSNKISKNGNLYHYSNEGVASWYDFAVSIMDISGKSCRVNPILAANYKTLAKRPQYSVLNKNKIKLDFEINIPFWRDSLSKCIKKISK